MKLLPIFLVVSLISVALTYALTGAGLWLLLAPFLGMLLAVGLLSWHMNFIYLLRAKPGKAKRSLAHLRLWRPILDQDSYQTMLAGGLVSAGRFAELETLRREARLDSGAAANLEYMCRGVRKDWEKAAEALQQGVQQSEGVWGTNLRLELVGLLTRRFPERLEEAAALYDQALQGPLTVGVLAYFLALESDLWIAAGQGGPALTLLQPSIEKLETFSKKEANLLGALAALYQRKGVALALLGDKEAAEQSFTLAKSTYGTDIFMAEVDEDLENMRAGRPLRGEPTAAAEVMMSHRSVTIRQEWPGGYGDMQSSGES